MENVKNQRRAKRGQSTRVINLMTAALAKDDQDLVELQVNLDYLVDLHKQIDELDQEVVKLLVEGKASNDDQDKEINEAFEYKKKYLTIKRKIESLARSQAPTPSGSECEFNFEEGKRRKLRLPEVELKKFSGDLMDWLSFWSQFQKIDEDNALHGSDKYQYLIQSIEPNTIAYDIVSSYPQSSENYTKVVEVLKSRFGNKDLLLQVYVRELLKLVITNATSKDKVPFQTLYLRLDSHLRALKTLELEKADPATWLFPLVESSLPEDVLLTWQRSTLSATDGSKENPPVTRVDLMMNFLKKEVEIQQKIQLAQTTFQDKKPTGRNEDRGHGSKNKNERVATLAGFHTGDTQGCVFCGKSHRSTDCHAAQKMSIDQKLAILKDKKLCFRCFKKGHQTKYCKTFVSCMICQRKHNTLMCASRDGGSARATQSPGPRASEATPPAKKDLQTNSSFQFAVPKSVQQQRPTGPPKMTTWSQEMDPENLSDMSNHVCTGKVALKTLFVIVHGTEGRRKLRAFIDSGSQRSYILRSTAKELKLTHKKMESIVHSLFTGAMTQAVDHKVYSIKVSSIQEDYHCQFDVRDSIKISNSIPRISKHSEVYEELSSKKIYLSDIGDGCPPIELLIGSDIIGRLETGNIIQLECGLTAVQTQLGWIVSGDRESTFQEVNMMSMTMSIADLWSLDVLGITDSAEVKTAAVEEAEATKNFMRTLERDTDGRYIAALPWREGHPELPSNKAVALQRLERCTKKLVDCNKYHIYDKIFQDWMSEGIIELVPQSKINSKGHYLPHRPHFKDSLTTPVRPVFDASCKVGKNPCLNDCLQKGANLIKKIPELLLRFREKKIGISSDIRKAFQMIGVKEDDRNFLRFLWWGNYNNREVMELQHARVVFGATCSPFILGAVLEFHLNEAPSQDFSIAKKLLESMYVDNSISSVDTKEEYYLFREKSTAILEEAKMDLRMWLTNFEDFEDPATVIVSVLGMTWNRKLDVIYTSTENIKIPEEVTKRTLLSTVQKVFDPLGILCPAIIPMKMLLQEVWISKLKWDEPLPDKERNTFLKWCSELKCLTEIQIPRLATAGVTDKSRWSLHSFSDASISAFSCVIFLRVETEEKVELYLLAAKARVTPVQRMSICRGEVTGCLVGSRLLKMIKDALGLENVKETHWCDSTTALAWIRRHDPWGTFVGNRVREIRALTSVENWRHVPGQRNPADLPSRGCSPLELLRSQWWQGPAWLKLAEETWTLPEEKVNEDLVIQERLKSVKAVVNMTILDEVKKDYTFEQLVRIMGWVLRFLNNSRTSAATRAKGKLTIPEMKVAEKKVVKCIQLEAFPEEHNIKGIVVQRDADGLLRVRTRIIYRDDLLNFKFPLLLPKKHTLVTKLIQEAHRKYCHAGTNFLMTKLREQYWILQSRKTIKGVISKCHRCRRFSAKPAVTEEAPLPIDRIKNADVFEVVGVDLAGPLFLKNQSKVWIVIYTCAVYRAVYLDLVTSCSTKAFIKSLKKFIEKFRRPEIIYSDNGRNFVGASNLFRGLDWNQIMKDAYVHPIQWKFNPPTGAWWGGWWERLIRVVKDLLKRTLGKSCLNKLELLKMLAEVGEIMNGRPLTYVSEDPEDLLPLTPSMFLKPASCKFPEGVLTEGKQLQMRYKYMQSLQEELKSRFRKEYLSLLVSKPKKKSRELQVGEVVFIGSDQYKRLDWRLGRIMELHPGKDGVSRVARVKTSEGILVRPIQRLYPLEVDSKVAAEMKKSSWKRNEAGRLVKAPEI